MPSRASDASVDTAATAATADTAATAATASPAATEARVPMSRERVLSAAIALADASGLEALTMRRLAQELGVEAMTLYYYVANKEEILRGIIEQVVGEFAHPDPEVDWKTALREMAISGYRTLLRHPWAAALMLSATNTSDRRFEHMESLLSRLRSAGFSPEMTHHAYHAIESHIMGFTLWIVGMNLDAAALPDMARQFMEQFPRDRFPAMLEHVETHLKPMVEYTGTEFEFGLDLILDGLERLLARGGGAA